MKAHPDFSNLYVSDHPLVRHKLSLMRETGCDKRLFRSLLREITMLMAYELTSNLEETTRKIETPLCEMDAPVLGGNDPVIVPILRAGLGMSEPLEELLPDATVGHVGLYRDPETKRPVEYLVKLPPAEGRLFYAVDPMLATGYSAKYALDCMMKHGVKPENTRFLSLLAAPEGIKVLLDAYPGIRIYTAALDDHLNDHAYIVPGLGDAGDRLFGTVGI